MDLGIAKMTPLHGESVKLEFKAEFFNLFNNAQWLTSTPTSTSLTSITSSLFGQITTTYDPRIIQFALKLIF